jgi:hypothetical protein
MRQQLTAESLQSFIKALAGAAREPARVYLVGGATAVLLGWRTSTIDVDLKIIPESDEILRSLPGLKEKLKINIELASPDDFIPPLPGWQERSKFIQQEGKLSFYHYDFYAQALAKLERRHELDRADIEQLFENKLIEPSKLLQLFSMIEGELHRYPQVDTKSFRESVEQAVKTHTGN